MATQVWNGTGGTQGDWSDAANWTSAVPVNGDDVILANNSVSVTAGLDQSAVALASLTIDQSYTGTLGSTSSEFLEIGASVVSLGAIRASGTQTGSPRLNLDLGTTTAAQVKVYNSAARGTDQNRMPIRLRAVNASTDIQVFAGSVGISEDTEVYRRWDLYGR